MHVGTIANAVKQPQINCFARGSDIQTLAALPRGMGRAVAAHQIAIAAASYPVPTERLDGTKPRSTIPRVGNHDGLATRWQPAGNIAFRRARNAMCTAGVVAAFIE